MKRSIVLLLFICLLFFSCTPQTQTPPPQKPTQKPTSPPPATAPATATLPPAATLNPTDTPTPEPKNTVFMISWDGAQASLVYDLINKGELPNFARLVENGVRAEYAQSVDPSLTTTAHNSISTGS